jgi:hypothetical protein
MAVKGEAWNTKTIRAFILINVKISSESFIRIKMGLVCKGLL